MLVNRVEEVGGYFYPPEEFIKKAHIRELAQYKAMYDTSIEKPETFWAEAARGFTWARPWERVLDFNFHLKQGPIFARWFDRGRTNMAFNCLDRHLMTRGDQAALIWEGNRPGEDRVMTYRELFEETVRFAKSLKDLEVRKGDRVGIFLPQIPELAVAVLACARIGAVTNVVFGGLSAESLRDRILDSGCRVLVTCDGTFRSGRAVPVKSIADQALAAGPGIPHPVEHVVVVRRLGTDLESECPMTPHRDHWWHEIAPEGQNECEPEWVDSEDPLFVLYASGISGDLKGVVHTTGGYMVYVALTHQYVFDHQEGDVHWCTGEVGWGNGLSYILYGPLLNGARTLMFEGAPTWPDPGRFWDVVDKWGVSVFYTAQTTLRTLNRMGEDFVRQHGRHSLRLLGTMGDSLSPEVWMWFHEVVGDGRCPIVGTWWQPETGGILMSDLPGVGPARPGHVGRPFLGVKPAILDEDGREHTDREASGRFAFHLPWPGQARTFFRDHALFEKTYFSDFDGYWFTGEGAKRNCDGLWAITGRVEDVIRPLGYVLGTAEIENVLVGHPIVAEAVVVGVPHPFKGEGICAFVTLKGDKIMDEDLKEELASRVMGAIGSHAVPDYFYRAAALPKTRSGKVIRRILRKMAAGETEDLEDRNLLADPKLIDELTFEKA